jgi:hypothetical protein
LKIEDFKLGSLLPACAERGRQALATLGAGQWDTAVRTDRAVMFERRNQFAIYNLQFPICNYPGQSGLRIVRCVATAPPNGTLDWRKKPS